MTESRKREVQGTFSRSKKDGKLAKIQPKPEHDPNRAYFDFQFLTKKSFVNPSYFLTKRRNFKWL